MFSMAIPPIPGVPAQPGPPSATSPDTSQLHSHRPWPPAGAQDGHFLQTRARWRGRPRHESQHPPRNLRRASTRPGTLHTVLISMGTILGGCSFMSWTLERQPGVTPRGKPTHTHATCPGERTGSYLHRVSLISCGRDMWHQHLSPGPGPPLPHPCLSKPHTYPHPHTGSETDPGPSQACSDTGTLKSLGCNQACRPSPSPSTCLEDMGCPAAGSPTQNPEHPCVLEAGRAGSWEPGLHLPSVSCLLAPGIQLSGACSLACSHLPSDPQASCPASTGCPPSGLHSPTPGVRTPAWMAPVAGLLPNTVG